MSDLQPDIPTDSDLQAPPAFARDLKALYTPLSAIPPATDEAILTHTQRRSVGRRRTRLLLRWAVPPAAAAAVIMWVVFNPFATPDVEDSPHFDELMRAALDITNDQSDAIAYKVLRGRRKVTASTLAELPEPAQHSEWSELAILRTDWSAEQCRLAVNFSRGKLDVELATHERVLFSGSSLPNITVDDNPLTIASEWEEVCWESDDDMDYIELEAQLSDGWRVQRQMLLARQDRFAYIADAVLGPRTGSIKYEHALPIVDSIVCEQPEETSEIFLIDRKRVATIIPLSLSEWKTDPRHGRLHADRAALMLECRGSTLYAPLFFDLDSAR
ncbi:MAG: hypothetical protein IIA33_03850, partial [Planctomycetes bacterium]|nr:hypothetical protein [Planctomycetota bacterium]